LSRQTEDNDPEDDPQPEGAMTQGEKALRWGRILHAAFLLASIAYVLLPVALIKTQTSDVDSVFVAAISVIAIATLIAAAFFRRRTLAPAAEALGTNPDDAEAAARWRRGLILSFVFCETAILFGLMLRVMGTSWNICGPFYIAGILLLLAWTPKLNMPPR
jgi:F0F1-type ATP synthase membrane subunit c/vacuolar-type H+-ATPase subunit K